MCGTKKYKHILGLNNYSSVIIPGERNFMNH